MREVCVRIILHLSYFERFYQKKNVCWFSMVVFLKRFCVNVPSFLHHVNKNISCQMIFQTTFFSCLKGAVEIMWKIVICVLNFQFIF